MILGVGPLLGFRYVARQTGRLDAMEDYRRRIDFLEPGWTLASIYGYYSFFEEGEV